jgi:5-methylcytosine-specific restriction protein A
MKLMNFCRLDPQYTASGKTGLPAGAKEEERVWKEFANDPIQCARVSRAIIASLSELETYTLPATADIDEGIEEAPEGRLLTRKHIMRERNRRLVQRKKRKTIKKAGKLECEACGFDFAFRYGRHGDGLIECHHTKPLATLAEGDKTHIDDLALVCANCHRIIHRGKRWLTVEDLKKILVASPSSV